MEASLKGSYGGSFAGDIERPEGVVDGDRFVPVIGASNLHGCEVCIGQHCLQVEVVGFCHIVVS